MVLKKRLYLSLTWLVPFGVAFNCRTYWYACQIKKGASSARSDDTKTLKSAILDWITPRGQSLVPALSRNIKIDHGFHHKCTGGLLCPANLNWLNNEYAPCIRIYLHFNLVSRVKEKLCTGEVSVSSDQWLIFLYHGYTYNKDVPWNGLFRSSLLI